MHRIIPIALLLCLVSPGKLDAHMPTHRDTIRNGSHDSLTPVIYPDDPSIAALDALWKEEMLSWQAFEADSICLNAYNYTWDSVPEFDSKIIAERLQKLNELTPLDLTYNSQVQAFINVYTKQRREVSSRVLGLAALYYPLFEEKLDQFDIPLEMKHLAVVESALNPNARSRVGATGLWQFMYTTGKMYGLQVDNYVDERRDPLQSTIAACRYLNFLYGMYNDWNLVLAAYNSGPGNVNKAIRRSGGQRDYWAIRPYLPRETRGYVPAFIAANYVMNYAADHNIYPAVPEFLFGEVDTLHICRETHFGQIAAVTGVPVEQLIALNPSLKRHMVPNSAACTVVNLPVAAVGPFLANVDSLYQQPALQPELVSTYTAPVVEVHTVRRGESLGLIAQRYGVSVSKLKEWNNLRSHMIRVGQKLEVHNPGNQATSSVQANNTSTSQKVISESDSTPNNVARTHTVQSGDTLWDIAKRYPGVSANDIIRANSRLNSQNLKPGQKISIPPAS